MDSLDNNIKNENKIPGSPGCDSFTRPEEISALSKFLGNIKRNQEQNLNLNNSLEDIPGKTTGLFHTIDNLNDDYVKMSSGEHNNITELSNTFVPLDVSIFDTDIDSLPQHLEGLNVSDLDLELEDKVIFNTVSNTDLNLGTDLVKINDVSEKVELETEIVKINDVSEKVELETEVVKINDVSEEVELETEIVKINDVPGDVELETEIVKINDISEDVELETEIVKINDVSEKVELETEIVKIDDVSEDVELETEIVTIDTSKKIELDNKIERIEVDKEINLDDKTVQLNLEEKITYLENERKDLINIKEINKLNNTVIDLNRNLKDPELSNSIIKLGTEELEPELDKTRLDLNKITDIQELSDDIINLENINKISKLATNDTIKLVEDSKEISELSNKLIDLSLENNEVSSLSHDYVKLRKDEEDLILNDYKDNLLVEKKTDSLSDTLVELESINEITQLNSSIYKIDVGNEEIPLGDSVLALEPDNLEIDLDKRKINLNVINNLTDLSNELINLEKVDNVSKLEESVIKLDIDSEELSELDRNIINLTDIEEDTNLGDLLVYLGEDIPSTKDTKHSYYDNINSTELKYTEKNRISLVNNTAPTNDINHDYYNNINSGELRYSEDDIIMLEEDIAPNNDTKHNYYDNTNSFKFKYSENDKKVLGEDIAPINDTKHDYYDNINSDELRYSENDKKVLGRDISPTKDTEHDYYDNINSKKLRYSENDKKVLGEDIAPTKDTEHDYYDNINSDEFRYSENDKKVLGEDIAPVNDTKQHDYYDNINSKKLRYSEDDREKIKTDISSSDIPGADHEWLNNKPGNNESIKSKFTNLKKKKDIITPGTYKIDKDKEETEEDYDFNNDRISDDLIPVQDINKPYNWFDNRLDENSSTPKTESTEEIYGPTIESDYFKEKTHVKTNISSNDIPGTDHDWLNNKPGNNETIVTKFTNLRKKKDIITPGIYKIDEDGKKTEEDYDFNNDKISDDLIPVQDINKPYNWFDNRLNENSSSPKTESTEEIYGSTIESDYFAEKTHVKTDIPDTELPINSKDGNHTWIDNTADSAITEDNLYDSYLGMKTVNSSIEDLSISPNEIPVQTPNSYDWFDNRLGEGSTPKTELKSKFTNLRKKKDIITPGIYKIDEDGKKTEEDYDFNNDKISDDLIPVQDINKPYNWFDNRLGEDSSSPKTESTEEIYGSTIESDYFKEKTHVKTDISDTELPINSKEGGLDEHKLKTWLSKLDEKELYNSIIDFEANIGDNIDGGLWIPSAKIDLMGNSTISLKTTVDNNSTVDDATYKDNTDLEVSKKFSEWVLFMKALVTSYLNPNYTADSTYQESINNLNKYQETIRNLISVNKKLREKKGKMKFLNTGETLTDENKNEFISIDSIPEQIPNTYKWFNNRSDSDEKELTKYMKQGPQAGCPGVIFDKESNQKSFNSISSSVNTNFSVSNYLRWSAELGVDGLMGLVFGKLFTEDKYSANSGTIRSLRRQLLEEALAGLIAGRNALEKVLKVHKYRLPGSDTGLLQSLAGDLLGGGVSAKSLLKSAIGEAVDVESDNPINRPKIDEETGKVTTYGWTAASARPSEAVEGTKPEDNTKSVSKVKDYFVGSDPEINYSFKNYLLGKGFERTLLELTGSTGEDLTKMSVESLYDLLKSSPYFSSSNKVTTTDRGFKVMTLDTNAHWEIIFEPYIGSENNYYTFLPMIEEINIRNEQLHNVKTAYNYWIPITSFELQKERLFTRTVGLFDGEIAFPISMEYSNEFRLTFADDQFKSWRTYFERCAQAAVFSSSPNIMDSSSGNVGVEKTVTVKETIMEEVQEVMYDDPTTPYIDAVVTTQKPKEIEVEKKIREIEPIIIDKNYHLVAPYKNIAFRCKVLVMTPQLSTINMYDLLLVMKEFTEERSGEIDSSGSDLIVSFSIVGENPPDTLSTSRYENNKSGGEEDPLKFSTWKEKTADKGKKIGGAIADSVLSIL